MFDMICPLPCEESVPSFSTMMVGVCPPKDILADAANFAVKKLYRSTDRR